MKKLLLTFILMVCIPGVVFAQLETEKIIEDRRYVLELHPYFRVYGPDKVEIILRADQTVQAVNWTGAGDWQYVAKSNHKFLLQYRGEFQETGMSIYLNLRGRSSYFGRIWGTGYYAIGNPSDLKPAPVFCYFIGKAQ